MNERRLLILILVIAQSIACNAQSSPNGDNSVVRMGPDINADLVVFFRKGTTWKEILEFNRSVIGNPNENGSGYSSLPGMMNVVKIEIHGYEGEAINFKPNAAYEEKAFVRKRVEASPLIYRVYENVVPEEITDLPDKEETEKKVLINNHAANLQESE